MHQDSQEKLVISCWPVPPDHAGSGSAFFGKSLWLSLCREPGARAPDCPRHHHTSLALPWEQQTPQLHGLPVPVTPGHTTPAWGARWKNNLLFLKKPLLLPKERLVLAGSRPQLGTNPP